VRGRLFRFILCCSQPDRCPSKWPRW